MPAGAAGAGAGRTGAWRAPCAGGGPPGRGPGPGRPQHTPTLSDASRLRDCLGEVQDEMAVMSDRHVAMQQANELLADLIGKLKAEPPEVPQATPRQTQVLHMRAEGAIQIPGSPGSHSPSSFSVPTQHQVSEPDPGRAASGTHAGQRRDRQRRRRPQPGRVRQRGARISASDPAKPAAAGPGAGFADHPGVARLPCGGGGTAGRDRLSGRKNGVGPPVQDGDTGDRPQETGRRGPAGGRQPAGQSHAEHGVLDPRVPKSAICGGDRPGADRRRRGRAHIAGPETGRPPSP